MYSSLLAATEGCFDKVPLDKLKTAEESLHRELKSKHGKLIDTVNTGDKVSEEHQRTIVDVAKSVAGSYAATKEAK
jgi:F0F1-type ATP synthase alpha subunit